VKRNVLRMRHNSQSSDRSPEDYLLFAIAVVGFVIAGGGVILSSPAIALAGVGITLLVLGCFLARTVGED
jgi:hypothetical protein